MISSTNFPFPLIQDFTSDELDKYSLRQCVRAYGYYKGRIYLSKYNGEDLLGPRKYVETSGGGIEEGEDKISALKRELLEELGAVGDVVFYFGDIGIEYYQLKRIDIASMYLFKIKEFKETHHTELENRLHQSVVSYTIDELLDILLHPLNPILEPLVYQREIYYLQKHFDYIKKIVEADDE